MFISDEDIEEKLKSPDNLVNRLTIHQIDRSRNVPNVPTEIQKVFTILGNEGETGTDLANAFDLDISGVNRNIRGLTGHGDAKPELKQVVQKVKSQIQQDRETAESQAVSALLASLELIPEAISRTKKAKQLSSVAKDMAAIANMVGNKNDMDGKGEKTVHLHLYAPRQKKVEEYEIIDVAS